MPPQVCPSPLNTHVVKFALTIMGERQARPIVLGLPKAKMKMLPLLDLNL